MGNFFTLFLLIFFILSSSAIKPGLRSFFYGYVLLLSVVILRVILKASIKITQINVFFFSIHMF